MDSTRNLIKCRNIEVKLSEAEPFLFDNAEQIRRELSDAESRILELSQEKLEFEYLVTELRQKLREIEAQAGK